MREKKEYLMKCTYVEKEREKQKGRKRERENRKRDATEIIKIPQTRKS